MAKKTTKKPKKVSFLKRVQAGINAFNKEMERQERLELEALRRKAKIAREKARAAKEKEKLRKEIKKLKEEARPAWAKKLRGTKKTTKRR